MSEQIIYYCEQGNPYCQSPNCRCNTVKPIFMEKSKELTPMQELKQHLQNMVDNCGDADLLCVIGLIDTKYLPKEKQVIEDAFLDGYCATDNESSQDYYNTKYEKYEI